MRNSKLCSRISRTFSPKCKVSSLPRIERQVWCRALKKDKLLKDVFTDCGDVTVVLELDGEQKTKVVHSEKEIDKIEAELQAERYLSIKE